VKDTSKFSLGAWGSWSSWGVAAALAVTVLAQPGTGAAAPAQKDKDKPTAPSTSPANTPPAPTTDKAKPAAPDTKATPVAKAGGPKVGEPVPEWSFKDSEGNTLALKDLRGKVVLMDFWATWCGPCKKIMPDLQKLHEEFGDKGLVVLGMNVWESQGKLSDEAADSRAIQFKKDKKYTYRGTLRADDAGRSYGVKGIPALFLVGPDGKLLAQWRGVDQNTAPAMRTAVKAAIDNLATTKGGTEATKPDGAREKK